MGDWRWSLGPYKILGDLTLEEFQEKLSQGRLPVEKANEILLYETKSFLRKREQAFKDKENFLNEALIRKVKSLRDIPSDKYGDFFEEMVCKTLDQYENQGFIFPNGINRLNFCQNIVTENLKNSIGDNEIRENLQEIFKNQCIEKIKSFIKLGLKKTSEKELAIRFALLMFEIDQRKVDNTWNLELFSDYIIDSLKGNSLDLVSVLCLINDFDYNGGYRTEPDLFAYLRNPKLEPIPLILDEINEVMDLFSYYMVKTNLIILIADTDYLEIGRYGPIKTENIPNINLYVQNLENYIKKFNKEIIIFPISEITNNNPLYQQVKRKILTQVTKMTDSDFLREWYQRFEDSVKKIKESQIKKKLYPKNEISEKSLEIAKQIWALVAGQGAILGALGPNTVLLSTESRERDLGYIVDKETKKTFLPALYILKQYE